MMRLASSSSSWSIDCCWMANKEFQHWYHKMKRKTVFLCHLLQARIVFKFMIFKHAEPVARLAGLPA
jgi:hypothetical protein